MLCSCEVKAMPRSRSFAARWHGASCIAPAPGRVHANEPPRETGAAAEESRVRCGQAGESTDQAQGSAAPRGADRLSQVRNAQPGTVVSRRRASRGEIQAATALPAQSQCGPADAAE